MHPFTAQQLAAGHVKELLAEGSLTEQRFNDPRTRMAFRSTKRLSVANRAQARAGQGP